MNNSLHLARKSARKYKLVMCTLTGPRELANQVDFIQEH